MKVICLYQRIPRMTNGSPCYWLMNVIWVLDRLPSFDSVLLRKQWIDSVVCVFFSSFSVVQLSIRNLIIVSPSSSKHSECFNCKTNYFSRFGCIIIFVCVCVSVWICVSDDYCHDEWPLSLISTIIIVVVPIVFCSSKVFVDSSLDVHRLFNKNIETKRMGDTPLVFFAFVSECLDPKAEQSERFASIDHLTRSFSRMIDQSSIRSPPFFSLPLSS